MDRDASRKQHRRDIFYSALPSQTRFHAIRERFKGFSGPVGSGKSQALCQEAIKLSYLNVGRTGLLGAPTYPMLRDATMATLLEILQSNRIPYDYNKGENVLLMRETRSRILLRSVDDFERLRGTNLAWFGLDELTYTQEESWTRLEARLRDPLASCLCGFAVWTPKGHDWVYQRFIGEPIQGYEAVLAKPYENRHLLKQVPDFYDRLRHSYDARFFQQEVMGEYLNSDRGRVYASFDRTVHVSELEPEPELPLLWALDFNVDPMSSVIVQIRGQQVVVLDEIVLSRATTMDACKEFWRRFGSYPSEITIYGDASGNQRHTTGSTDYEIIRGFFSGLRRPVRYQIPSCNPLVRDRVNVLNGKMLNAAGEAELFVHKRCEGLIKDFEQVVYQQGSNAIDKNKDPKRSHLSDALGYLVFQECRRIPKSGEKNVRLL